MVADFCYGIDIKLTVSNVAALRCAAEYLQMTETMQPGNLIECTDNYLSQEIFGNLSACLQVLLSCAQLLPHATSPEVRLVSRCAAATGAVFAVDPMLQELPVAWFCEVVVGAVEESKFSERKGMAREIGSAIIGYAVSLQGSDGERGGLDQIVAACEAMELMPHLRSDFFQPTELVELLAAASIAECKHVRSLEKVVGVLIASGRSLPIGCVPPASIQRAVNAAWEAEAAPAVIMSSVVAYIQERLRSTTATAEELPKGELEMLVGLLPTRHEMGGSHLDAKDLIDLFEACLKKKAACKARLAELACPEGVGMLDARLLAMASKGELEPGVFQEVAGAICLPSGERACLDGTYFVLEKLLESSPEMSARDRIDLCVALEFRRLSPKVLEKAANNQYIPARCIAQGAAGALTALENRVVSQHREQEQALHEMQSVINRQGDEIKQLRVLVASIARDARASERSGMAPTAVVEEDGEEGLHDEGHLVDVSIELNMLIEEGNFEGAFSRALHSNTADLLVWTCYNTKPEVIFRTRPPKLSQSTTLALVQHLSCKLERGPDTAGDTHLKLTWLCEALLALDRSFDNSAWTALLAQVR